MSSISSSVNIPVIASGGVGNLDHLVEGIKTGKKGLVFDRSSESIWLCSTEGG